MAKSFGSKILALLEKGQDGVGLSPSYKRFTNANLKTFNDFVRVLKSKNTSKKDRGVGFWLLTRGIDSRAYQVLRSLLNSREAEMRVSACWALGRLNDQRATKSLLRALDDSNVLVVSEACTSLKLQDDPRATRKLVSILEGKSDIDRKVGAAYALGNRAGKAAIRTLLIILTDRSAPPPLRGQAAESLANIGDKRAVGKLIQCLTDSSVEVRFWCAFALGRLGSKRAIPQLSRLAKSDRSVLTHWWSVSKEASDAINQIRHR